MNTQKWEVLLFAEDLVSFLMNTKVMWKHSGFSASKAAPRAGAYRDFVYNGFNEIVKKAAYILYDRKFDFIERQFIRMIDTSNVNDESFKIYAKDLWEKHFSGGIEAISFLRYCVVITGLAGGFYLEAIKSAPDYAAQIIAYHFPRADCLKVTWDVLHRAAKNYVRENIDEMYSQLFAGLDNDPSLNMDCNCFKTNINGPSFKKIYGIRGKLLKLHFLLCMRDSFDEAYENNLIMRTEGYEKDDQTYISSDETGMDDIYFTREQSSMSALHKISQAARNSVKSSDNNDYTTSRNPENGIHSNPGNQTNKSSVLKISQEVRHFVNSSDNHDYTTSRNPENVIHSNSGNLTDTSGVLKTSQSAEFSERPSSSGTFLSSTVPKDTNRDADSVIFKKPKSVKRFKMSDNENGKKRD